MKLSKFPFFIILVCLSLLLMSGCNSPSNEIKLPSEVYTNSTTSPTNDVPEQSTTSPREDHNTSDTDSPDEEETTSDGDVIIEETVLFEADNIKITAVSLDKSWMGQEITLLIENNSANNILVTTESVSINGFMSPLSGLYAEVASGKKAYDTLNLSSTNMEQANIDIISNIQFFLNISDKDSWDDLYESELITLVTSAKDHTQIVDDSGDILYDRNGIQVVCKGLKQDILWDGTVVFLIRNSSGKNIIVSTENVSVNGFMCNATMWANLRDETNIIDGMSLIDLSELHIETIDDISDIEFSLQILDEDSWDEIDITEAITLNFASDATSEKSTEGSESLEASTSSASDDADWRKFLSDYEAWVDSYIEFMQEYKANPTDLSLLSDYSKMLSEMADWSTQASNMQLDITDAAEAAEYSSELLRIANKLLEVAN